MQAPEAVTLAELEQRLREQSAERTVLVFRIADLERMAWRDGRRLARSLERDAIAAFRRTAAAALREDDIIAHDQGSDVFVAALAGSPRDHGGAVSPADAHGIAVRFERAFKAATDFHVETGWTGVSPGDPHAGLGAKIVEALERGSRARERFAFFSTVGHELRTPLGAIRGYLEEVIDGTVEGDQARRFLEIAMNETIRLRRLVDGMFEVSLFDLTGGPGPSRESCDLSTAIAAARDVVAPLAAARGTKIVAADAAGSQIALAPDQAEQLFANLFENAIRHGKERGLVKLTTVATPRFVDVHVDDDGPGVPLDDRQRIFNLATRGSTATARGTGLGLALVRMFAERAGGDALVTGSPLGGARFTVRLPVVSGAAGIADEREAG